MAQSDNFYSKKTSVFWTCKALKDGRTIAHQDEMTEIGAWRLGAIIHRLKKELHWPISVECRGPENVAHYSMATDMDRTKLRLPRSARIGASGGCGMKRLRVSRLRRLYGRSETQARFVAALAYGEARDGG
jgi:hypothetical protein